MYRIRLFVKLFERDDRGEGIDGDVLAQWRGAVVDENNSCRVKAVFNGKHGRKPSRPCRAGQRLGDNMAGFLAREGRRLVNNCIWSWQGWTACWETENTLRQWTIVNILSVIATVFVPITTMEQILLVALGLLILAAELMNTAVEEVVDYLSTEEHPRAKKAKDAASAAVAVTALSGGIVWVMVLFNTYG